MSLFSGILDAVGTATTGIPWGSVANIGSSLISGAFGSKGQEDTNAANLEINARQMDFNSAEAAKSRDFNANQAQLQRTWQEDMSKTQYQRAVGDLTNAGLNPMLAYMNGGNQAGSGAAASSSPANAGAQIPMGNKIAAGLNAAAQAAQINNVQAQTKVADSQAKLNEALAGKAGADTDLSTASASESRARTERIGSEIKQITSQIGKIDAETLTETQKYWLTIAQRNLTDIQTEYQKGNINTQELQQRLIRVETQLKEYEVNAAKAGSNFAGTAWGQTISPILGDIGKIIGIAGGATRLAR